MATPVPGAGIHRVVCKLEKICTTPTFTMLMRLCKVGLWLLRIHRFLIGGQKTDAHTDVTDKLHCNTWCATIIDTRNFDMRLTK